MAQRNRTMLVNEIFKLLQDKSCNWYTIGREMGISVNDRESLKKDVSRNDKERLEVIIDEWLTALPSEFTWDGFIDILANLGYQDVIKEVMESKGLVNKSDSSSTTATAITSSDPTVTKKTSNVIQCHYSDLSKAIAGGSSPDVLLSVSNEFYQHSFIDLQTKTDINRSGGLTGASMLLDYIMLKIDRSDHYLPLVMDILREEVALRDIVHKMDPIVINGYDASIVPVWCRQELSSLHYETLPVYRTFKDFNKHKRNNAELFSDPFYTSDGGYRATLSINPNGEGSGEGTHVSAYIHLMKGANDDNLEFPITGIFTMEILNWKGNNHHVEKSIEFDDGAQMKHRERVTTRERASGRGVGRILPHDDLMSYLHHDMMCFKIGYYPIKQTTGCSPVPSWCDVKYSTSATPPCTRTLTSSYSLYKKANGEWYSPPFYSSDKGYKLQLKVFANGHGSGGKGTHLSLFVYLMKGEYDDFLSWPFNATITVQLLNWPSDDHHEEDTIHHHRTSIEDRQRVVDGTRASGGRGCDFISHTHLESPSEPAVRFINDDNICFRIISVDIIN